MQEPGGAQDEHEVDTATMLDLDVPGRRVQPEENLSLVRFAMDAEEPFTCRHGVRGYGERDPASRNVIAVRDGEAVPPPTSEGRGEPRAFDPREGHREGHITVIVGGRNGSREDVERDDGRHGGIVPAKPVDPSEDCRVPVGEPGPEKWDDLLINKRRYDALKLVESLSAEAPGDLAPPR